MDGLMMLRSRRSVREYIDKDIPKQIIEQILDCARLAPTARNEQPWIFLVVKDRQKILSISDATDHGKFIKDANTVILVLCENTKYYLEDGCAATENILLAATYFNIGSCWVAGDKKNYCDKIKQLFSVPENYKLVSIVSLGYVKENMILERKNKKFLSDLVYFENYGQKY